VPAADLARPGHIFPLRAREGGVLVRAGQTRLPWTWRAWRAGPRRVICEIMNDDGAWRASRSLSSSARGTAQDDFVAEIIRYRMKHEAFLRGWRRAGGDGVRRVSRGRLCSQFNPSASGAGAGRGGRPGTGAGADALALLFGDGVPLDKLRLGALVRNSLRANPRRRRGVLVYLHETGLDSAWSGDAGRVPDYRHNRDVADYKGEAGQRRCNTSTASGARYLDWGCTPSAC